MSRNEQLTLVGGGWHGLAPPLVFYRRFNSRRESNAPVSVDVPHDAELPVFICAAEQVTGVALTRRTSTTGVFEVQTSKGIWQASDGGALTRFVGGKCVARPEAQFKSWDDMEREEEMEQQEVLTVAAVEIRQGGRVLYAFGFKGKLWPRFATVSRIRRQEGALFGYQRPEVLAHVANIREYMDSERPLVPNAVVFAFDSRARFEPMPGQAGDSRVGRLHIPLAKEGERPVAFIVDGQQRLAAIRDSAADGLELAATGFITDEAAEQAEQFILVNSTRPLPKGLIYELLPTTHAQLPPALHKLRGPAALVQRLNGDEASPLRGLLITATNPRAAGAGARGNFTGLAKDTSFLKALANSLNDGALYRLAGDEEAQARLLFAWWGAVRRVWPKAWGLAPKESRLFHGAGVIALSMLMDYAVEELTARGVDDPHHEHFVEELRLVADACAWTREEKVWAMPGGEVAWNGLQNTPSDVERLTRFLTRTYQRRAQERLAAEVKPRAEKKVRARRGAT